MARMGLCVARDECAGLRHLQPAQEIVSEHTPAEFPLACNDDYTSRTTRLLPHQESRQGRPGGRLGMTVQIEACGDIDLTAPHLLFRGPVLDPGTGIIPGYFQAIFGELFT